MDLDEASMEFNASDEWHRYDWIEQDDDGFFERPYGEPKGKKHYLTEAEVIDFLLEGNQFLFDKVKKLEGYIGHSEITLDLNSPNTVTSVSDLVSTNSETNTDVANPPSDPKRKANT